MIRPMSIRLRRSALFVMLALMVSITFGQSTFFPTRQGTLWRYHFYPGSSSGYQANVSITKDSSAGGNTLVFLNNSSQPEFLVDSLHRVFSRPLGSNGLVYDFGAAVGSSWPVYDASETMNENELYARVKERSNVILFGAVRRSIGFEYAYYIGGVDTFGFAHRQEFFAEGVGLYAVTIEPPQYERILIGAVIVGDTLGTVTTAPDIKQDSPRLLTLLPNFPNPVNSATNIRFYVPSETTAQLAVLDVAGRLVEVLFNGARTEGIHQISWNSSRVSTGTYFVVLRAAEQQRTIKLQIIK